MTASASRAELRWAGRSPGCAAVVVAALALVAACGLPDTPYFGRVPERIEPGHLRYCGQGEPEELDPTMASTTVAVRLVHQMFDGLVVYDLDGKPVPGLARSWEVSEDRRTWTFHLRGDARWSNGRALDAYDVGYQVMRVLHPTTASPNASNVPTLVGAAGFTERRLAVLERDAAPYRAGQVVELVTVDDRPFDEAPGAPGAPGGQGERANPNVRVVEAPLRLRDLGASREYAQVPAGQLVEVLGDSGSKLLPPAPGGTGVRWAYVYWGGDGDPAAERYGWVQESELGARKWATSRFGVRRGPLAEQPSRAGQAGQAPRAPPSAEQLSADASAGRPIVVVRGDALSLSPDVLGVRVIDRHTIAFENSGPTPYFLYLAVNRALRPTPVEAVSRSPRGWARPGTIVTSGAMHLAVWKERDRVELVRSATYWNPAEVKLDKLTAYSLDDATAAANLYYTGRCDAVATNQIPGSYLPTLRGERRPGGHDGPGGPGAPYRDYKVAPFLSSYFVLINAKQLPNVHLRRALSLAVDRAPIPAFTHGGEHPTSQLTPGAAVSTLSAAERALCGVEAATDPERVAMIMVPGELCYLPPPGLGFDLRRAAEELAIARRELGAAFPAVLTYRYNEGSEVHKLIAELLQQQWQRLGLTVELQAQEWRSLVADTARGNYQLARFGNAATFPDPATEYLELFACGSPFNRTGTCDAELDRQLAQIRATGDAAARNRLIYAAEQRIVGDAAIVPLYVYTQRQLQKPYVRDLGMNLVDQQPLYRAWLDPEWRKR
jgi:oligopeptide transport system substrate-binding protein